MNEQREMLKSGQSGHSSNRRRRHDSCQVALESLAFCILKKSLKSLYCIFVYFEKGSPRVEWRFTQHSLDKLLDSYFFNPPKP